MTPITRRLARLTDISVFSQGKRRSVVIELDPQRPGLVGFRLKATRTTYYLPVDWCYREALRNEIARLKSERRKKRNANPLRNRT